jgi:hypothetical protein
MSTSRTGRHGLRKIAAFAAVTALAGGFMAGSAKAGTYAGGGAYAGGSNATVCDGSCAQAPPTANLSALNSNMRVVSKGVSAAVHFDPGLVTGGSSVAVTVKWGSVAQTSGYYNNSAGSRFAFDFPANDGSQRWEVINVTMTERLTTSTSPTAKTTTTTRTYSYTAGRSVPIKGVWDVSLSPINFKLLDDCDPYSPGDSEIDLYVSHSGAYGNVGFDIHEGNSHLVTEFPGTWNEVGVSSDLRVPIVRFSEEDPTGAWLGGGPTQDLSNERLLPGTSHHTSFVVNEATGQCRAQIDYDNFINVHHYNV